MHCAITRKQSGLVPQRRLQWKRIDSSRFELRMLLQVWERRIHSSNARLIPIGSWLSQSSGLGMAVKRLGQMS